MKNLRIGFSLYGAIIVAMQTLPNIVWALFPPSPNALSGNASKVLFIEYGEHILGVAIVILLLFLVCRGRERIIPRSKLAYVSFAAIAIYWFCWVLYYCAVQALPVIYAMVILPPVAFFCAGAASKVYPISVISAVFLVFHLAVAAENFPITWA